LVVDDEFEDDPSDTSHRVDRLHCKKSRIWKDASYISGKILNVG
ncbi:hypothetical protein AVEN_134552-1, partial [Araneus ventricosus]